MTDYAPGSKEVQTPMFKVDGPGLVFGNETMRKGQNFTVRYGSNYATERKIEVGQYLKLTTVDGGYIGEALVTHIVICKLKDIPANVLKNQHDPVCVNPFGLYYELMQHYVDSDKFGSITPDTFFTSIGFEIHGGE